MAARVNELHATENTATYCVTRHKVSPKGQLCVTMDTKLKTVLNVDIIISDTAKLTYVKQFNKQKIIS